MYDKKADENIPPKKQFGYFGIYQHYAIGAGIGLLCFVVFVLIGNKFVQ